MLVVLSWTCTQNKTMPVGMSWDCLEDQAPVTIKDPFSPREKSKCSKCLSLLPSNWAHAVLCGQQDSRCWFTLCVWKLFVASLGGSKGGQWDSHQSTAASCTSLNYPKNGTIEEELPWHRSMYVFTQSVLCASSGLNARLPFICCC